jgi:hydroxymethylpyrimidine/phosphomethylpyrimidine kinase
MKGRVLIVAGSDSGGGAGIQADIKTVTALGGYAATAVTALTAQNTRGVFGVVGVEPAFIRQQIDLVLDDIGADAIKTGMLHSVAVIEAVAGALEARLEAGSGADAAKPPLVVDPVMVAQSGDPLLAEDAVAALAARLIPLADLITPNLPEAGRLLGRTVTAEGCERFEHPRIDTPHTHGTGCTLASAIATGLAQGLALRAAVERALAYLQEAIRSAPGLGHGHGPVNHGHTVRPFP